MRVQREAEAGGNAASWSFRKCQPQQRDTLRRSVHCASCWSTSTAARNIDAPRKLTALRSSASAACRQRQHRLTALNVERSGEGVAMSDGSKAVAVKQGCQAMSSKAGSRIPAG